MRTIWKFAVPQPGVDALYEIPAKAQPLMVGLDPEGIRCVWLEVSTENPLESKRLFIVGTGHGIRIPAEYCGSYTEGQFVWHVYLG